MSTHETTIPIDGPYTTADPLRELIRFFETNGYKVTQETVEFIEFVVDVKGRRDEAVNPPAPENGSASDTDLNNPTDTEDTNKNDTDQAEDDDARYDAGVPPHNGDVNEDDDAACDKVTANDAGGRSDAAGNDGSPSDGSPSDDSASEDGSSGNQDIGNDDTASKDASEEDEDDEDDEEASDGDEVLTRVLMTRGKPGASIWSSNMTDLYAQITLTLTPGGVLLKYVVETTMQNFTDDDIAFWRKEAKHARSFAAGLVDAPIDWRENEAHRVDQIQSDIVVTAVQLGIAAMLIVFVLYMVFAG